VRSKSIALPTLSALALVTSLAVPALASAEEGASAIEEGKRIAFNRKKGNCLACHAIEGMPPFGKHEILEPDELDKVVEFIYSL